MTYRTQLVAWTMAFFGTTALMAWSAWAEVWPVFAVSLVILFFVWLWAKVLQEWGANG